MTSSIDNFSGKTVAILGFGVEGQSAAAYLAQNEANVTVFDEKEENTLDKAKIAHLSTIGVNFVFGAFPDLNAYDLIIRSPGIPLTNSALEKISEKMKITSVTKLFFDLCPSQIIGVTGTKGKGTTSSLIYEMLKSDGKDAYLGGNIGVPAVDFLDKLNEKSFVVLELSSFQLIDLYKSPHIAVMLMVTSEHLDYHKDITEYVEAKRNIVRFQTVDDYAVLNKDYPASNESDIHTEAKVYFVSREQEVDEGCFVQNGEVILRRNGIDESIIQTKDILLAGAHNWENVCAAVMAATLAGVSKEKIVGVLMSFKGLEHRLELVKTVRGVRYYDDSFSTTPETAQAAIEAFSEPEVLILGGSSKNSNFEELGKLIEKTENIKAIIGIGKEWERMKAQFPISKFQLPILEDCKTMEEVVRKAAEITEPGDVVLLSPACASFDMFKNYKERGNQFKNEVNKLDSKLPR